MSCAGRQQISISRAFRSQMTLSRSVSSSPAQRFWIAEPGSGLCDGRAEEARDAWFGHLPRPNSAAGTVRSDRPSSQLAVGLGGQACGGNDAVGVLAQLADLGPVWICVEPEADPSATA